MGHRLILMLLLWSQEPEVVEWVCEESVDEAGLTVAACGGIDSQVLFKGAKPAPLKGDVCSSARWAVKWKAARGVPPYITAVIYFYFNAQDIERSIMWLTTTFQTYK